MNELHIPPYYVAPCFSIKLGLMRILCVYMLTSTNILGGVPFNNLGQGLPQTLSITLETLHRNNNESPLLQIGLG